MADEVPLTQAIRERLTLMGDPAGALAMLPDPLPSDPHERAHLLQLAVAACVSSGDTVGAERFQAARLAALRAAGRDAAAESEERCHDVLLDPAPGAHHLPQVLSELQRALAAERPDPELVAGLHVSAVGCSAPGDALELAESGTTFCRAHPAELGEFTEFLQLQSVSLLSDLGLGDRAVHLAESAASRATFRWIRASLWRLAGLIHGNRLEFSDAAQAFQEAFEVFAQIGHRAGMVETAEASATMSRLAGATDHACAMLSLALSLGLSPTAERLVTLAELRTQTGDADANATWARALDAQQAEGATPEQVAQSRHWQGMAALRSGESELAEAALRAALTGGTDPVALASGIQLAEMHLRDDDAEGALVLADQACALARELELPEQASTALRLRGTARIELGDERGMDDLHEAMTVLPNPTPDQRSTLYASRATGWSRLDVADRAAADFLSAAADTTDPLMRAHLERTAAVQLARSGRAVEGEHLLRAAIDELPAGEPHRVAVVGLIDLLGLLGRTDEAERVRRGLL